MARRINLMARARRTCDVDCGDGGRGRNQFRQGHQWTMAASAEEEEHRREKRWIEAERGEAACVGDGGGGDAGRGRPSDGGERGMRRGRGRRRTSASGTSGGGARRGEENRCVLAAAAKALGRSASPTWSAHAHRTRRKQTDRRHRRDGGWTIWIRRDAYGR